LNSAGHHDAIAVKVRDGLRAIETHADPERRENCCDEKNSGRRLGAAEALPAAEGILGQQKRSGEQAKRRTRWRKPASIRHRHREEIHGMKMQQRLQLFD